MVTCRVNTESYLPSLNGLAVKKIILRNLNGLGEQFTIINLTLLKHIKLLAIKAWRLA